ncbi:MBL fold metallo-hydrolase [Melaminivora sp.]|uniref:MBL fold metallo-hydrolase n=1 Tax=Melaminivora sp. TaxID=1933032 RepID=UPI0028AC9211|nr:MBL fold metallo-hydrolase [Melaminivora sp.]
MQPTLTLGPVRVYLGAKSGKYPDGNQVVVQGADSRAAFDTPLVSREIGADLDGADLLILSHMHEDHAVGLGRLQQAQLHVHEADVQAARSWEGFKRHYGYPDEVLDALHAAIVRDFDYQPRPDALAYTDGQMWELGGGVRVRAHHLPGHSSGHSALVEESSGTAFIGDIDLTGFGPYYGDAGSSLEQFARSLERLKELDARAWVTSHHRGVLTERADFLQALARFAAKIDERDQRLCAWLGERPQTLAELAGRGLLYPPGVDLPWVTMAEQRTIEQHLARLQEGGAVRQDEDGRYHLA